MNEEEFQRKLAELVQEIGTLPPSERAKLEQLAQETKTRHKELKETVSALQDSIDFLRLSIKYILFDLEATRRENGFLRRMLDAQAEGDEYDPEGL
jgi:septal ring factor EnvC (AmiA/AmiB activator)